MLATILDTNGRQLDAKFECSDGAITLYSRGGARGGPNLRNPDYRTALRLILERLTAEKLDLAGVWLDSSVARRWSEDERLLVGQEELNLSVAELVTLIGQRGAAKGRPWDVSGHGNSTKRIRIAITGATPAQLMQHLEATVEPAIQRLPSPQHSAS
jgi:5-methylcytosine-specific restriction protein A